MGFRGDLTWFNGMKKGDYRASINQKTGMLVDVPSGKQPDNYGKSPCFSFFWVNQRFRHRNKFPVAATAPETPAACHSKTSIGATQTTSEESDRMCIPSHGETFGK